MLSEMMPDTKPVDADEDAAEESGAVGAAAKSAADAVPAAMSKDIALLMR
jgi:hypothetical protein